MLGFFQLLPERVGILGVQRLQQFQKRRDLPDRLQLDSTDRDAFRKERLFDGWWMTAEQVPEEVVTHGDVHKAREALAKGMGVFTEQKVQVDTQITIIHESA